MTETSGTKGTAGAPITYRETMFIRHWLLGFYKVMGRSGILGRAPLLLGGRL